MSSTSELLFSFIYYMIYLFKTFEGLGKAQIKLLSPYLPKIQTLLTSQINFLENHLAKPLRITESSHIVLVALMVLC